MRLKKQEKTFLLRFALLFFLPFIAVHALDLDVINSAVAATESTMLNAIGYQTTLDGTGLAVEGKEFKIVTDCSGVVLVILLFALLYATLLKEKKRRKTLLWATPFLLCFNLLRLLLTLAAGAVLGQLALDIIHPLMWFVDSGVVLFIWMRAARVKTGFKLAGIRI